MIQLNKEQVQAVKYKGGPLLIIAGAGTGKTTVITERIKYLITSGLAKPSEILALTFTEKAAREMQERVDVAMPYGYTNMWISTFHSFCDHIIRDEGLHIGLDPRFKLLTQAEGIKFVRDNLFEFELDYFRPLGNPTKFVSGILQHFSRLQDEDITPSQYVRWAKEQRANNKQGSKEAILDLKKWLELAKAYRKYDELKVQKGFLDFGDLIIKTLELFRKRPNILKIYQKQFKFVLVDEFQDTNIAQNELVKILVKKNGNITVVADDDQSIYKWRGAAVSNVIQFRDSFPKTKVIVLSKNYRSKQEILDRAYELIQNNNPDRLEVVEGINKKLVSMRSSSNSRNTLSDDAIEFLHADRVENEAELVAKKIVHLTKEKRYEYKDIAILVRANKHSEPFIRALSRYSIPYQFLGPGRLFRQNEVIDLISYLKVLNNFEDSVSFYRLLSIPEFNIRARDLESLGNFARRKNLSLFEASEPSILDSLARQGKITKEGQEKIEEIVRIINKHLKLVRKETAGQLLYYFLEEAKLLTALLNPQSAEAEKRALNISKFFDKLKSYEIDHEDATVGAVIDWIDLASEVAESPLAANEDWLALDAVNILTVHSSKGLEFPVVFLVNLVGQRFPTPDRKEQIPIPEELIKEVLPKGDYHLQEERRLFYVGVTRAQDFLFLTASDYYGGGKRERSLSPFIFESLGEKVAIGLRAKKDDSKQLSFLDYEHVVGGRQKAEGKRTIRVDYLSYSQIETFKICPLHYKLKYILNIPTPPSSSQSFGNSFHLTMKAFYKALAKGEKASEKLFLKILEENWINEGYLSKSHEKRSYEKAKKFLKFYLNNYYDPKVKPVALEQPFTVRINNFRVGGKIDRLDLKEGILEIIDYKTGANPITESEAKRDLQLSIYALAATNIPEFPFAKKPEEVRLSLYYFDTPKIVTTTRTKEDLEKAKGEIENYKKQIEESDFSCSGNILCEKCEYSLFCRSEKGTNVRSSGIELPF